MATSWGRFASLAGGFVDKFFVQGQPFELADLVLIQGADAQVADPLAFGRLVRSGGVRIDSLGSLQEREFHVR